MVTNSELLLVLNISKFLFVAKTYESPLYLFILPSICNNFPLLSLLFQGFFLISKRDDLFSHRLWFNTIANTNQIIEKITHPGV